MPQIEPILAKLSHPRLHDPLDRQRLFALLDANRRIPLVWISGPPGSGKSTLVASYLRARRLMSQWYQVDSGDADPPSLFYYLGEMARPLAARSDKRPPLPYFTPEYAGDLLRFARRYFRMLFQRTPNGLVYVFDNCHEAAGSAFDEIIKEACTELPEGIILIFISRQEPPASLARLIASNAILRLDWDDLRLTLEETASISVGTRAEDADLRVLHRQSGGWVAGLMLLLASARREEAGTAGLDLSSRETLFHFFAGEIFDRAPGPLQSLLLQTSLFREVTPGMAAAITGNPEAGKLLDSLYRRQYFTSRKGEPELTYQYHDLFRDFLLSRLHMESSADALRALQRRAAQILEIAGRLDDTIELCMESEDWTNAGRLICSHGNVLLSQGRWTKLGEWLMRLPRSRLEADPWLSYWSGMAMLPVAAGQAVPTLEHAARAFQRDGNIVGATLAAAAVCEAIFYRYSAFADHDRWIPVLHEFIQHPAIVPDSLPYVRAVTALIMALYQRGGDPKLTSRLTADCLRCLQADLPALQKVEIGTRLLIKSSFSAELAESERAIAMLDPIASLPQLPPLRKAWWNWAVGRHLFIAGEREAALARAEIAVEIAREHGFNSVVVTSLSNKLFIMLSMGASLATVEPMLQEIDRAFDANRPMEAFYRGFAHWIVAHLRGDRETALRYAEEELVGADAAGSVIARSAARARKARALADFAKYDEALELLTEARRLVDSTSFWRIGIWERMIQAHVLLLLDRRDEAAAILAESLRIARESGAIGYLAWDFHDAPHLLQFAWDRQIEQSFIQKLVNKYDLHPADNHLDWPWPVRIQCLGGFKLVEPQLSNQKRKPPHRLLELLKAIIALGPDVPTEALMEALWPDADGDQAQSNLGASLHRLRKLLGREDAVVQRDGRIALNDKVCHVDAFALDGLLKRIGDQRLDGAQLEQARRCIALYCGHLFKGDSQPWISATRERLRARLQRLVLTLARQLEVDDELDEALRLYERLIEIEPTSESAYRNLMACLKRAGRIAEARDAYVRCKRMLVSSSASMPSAETQSLYADLRGA